jgi:hypothetical protein
MSLTTYTIRKFKDNFILSNTGATTITVSTLVKQEDCITFLQVKDDFTILPGNEKTVVLGYDGEYKLSLIDSESEVSDIKVLHYLSLEKSMIADIQYVLCDCMDDPDCADCKGDNALKQLSTVLKIFSYQRLTHPQHAAFLEVVFEPLKCSVNDLTISIVLEEQTKDNVEYSSLIKKILSFYYLAFYFSEYKSVSLEEQDYVNTKYQYSTISTCIDSTLLADVQTKIDNMATFTVVTGAYVNQAPTIGDNTITPDNRVTTTLTLDMFTSQTTPPYNDPEGDPVDALRIDTVNVGNAGVFQYDNVDVTEGLIIPAAHIDAGRFTHVGGDINDVANDVIGFSLRDTGSMEWVS